MKLWLYLAGKILAAPVGRPVQAHLLAVVYGLVSLFPDGILGPDGADGGVGGGVLMLAEGTAVVGMDVDAVWQLFTLRVGCAMILARIDWF